MYKYDDIKLGCYYSLYSFKKNKKISNFDYQNSEHFGSRAVRIIEVGLYLLIIYAGAVLDKCV